MLKLAMVTKLLKGGFGPDELGALMEAAGMNVEFRPVERKHYTNAFAQAGAAAQHLESRVVQISGHDKDGSRIEALLIFAPTT